MYGVKRKFGLERLGIPPELLEGRNIFSGVNIPKGRSIDLPRILPDEVTTETADIGTVIPQEQIPLPEIASPSPVNPELPPISASQEYLNQLNEIRNKDYGIKEEPILNAEGQVVGTNQVRGKDRKKSWGLLEKLSNIALGAGRGFLKGGVIGSIVEGLRGGTDRNYYDKFQDSQKLPRITENYNQAVLAEKVKADQDYNTARTANVYADNTYQNERLAEMREDRKRKVEDRKSRERTNRMTQVAGMFKNIPEFIPGDPRYADIEKALGDVDLPITPKDAKKKVDLKQDQRTGEWTVVLTNPLDGKQEVRSVMKDGQPFKSTPTVVMQGEYGMLRQNDQQTFTAQQNQLSREHQLRLQEIGQQQKIQLEQIQTANEQIKSAQNAEQRRQAEERRSQATQVYNDLRNERIRLQNQKTEKELLEP